ncbi:MAG: polysaccharide biosynthesis C-terminal domain-containing protein, partial [Candidatus Bathyarchaeia archaeon]
ALVYMGGLGLIISLVLVTLAPLIVNILLGPKYSPAISVMRVLATLPFLIALSNVFGIQVMLPFHLDRAFFTILVVAGLINILTALLLVPIWGAMGMAISVAFTEFYVTATMFFYLKSKNLLPIRPKGVA